VFLAPCIVVTESVDAVAVDDDVTVSDSLRDNVEADSAAFVIADKSMDQTDGNFTTVSVDSHGTPSSQSASVAEGFAQHDDVTSQKVNSGLIDLPRPNRLSMAEVVMLIHQPADSTVVPCILTGKKNSLY